jgi:aminopeptidase-like protein
MGYGELLKEELSGSIAKSFVAEISRFHRIQGSTMFHEAAEYVKSELTKIGLNDVNIEQFPADGAQKFWTHTSPIGWSVKSAELRLVEPEEKLMCRYEDIPQSLHAFSSATPPQGVTAELVDVGSGTTQTDYEGKDVKGKFVLATGRAKAVHEKAVYKYGASGVITDALTVELPNVRESLDVPDAHAYQAIWPSAEDISKVAFGFSLSKRQGTNLRAMLKDGKKVKLKAIVDAEFFSGKLDVVTAAINGKSKDEVFLVAHLCHPKPSANDNASGSGALLEIARTIKSLINTGKITQPQRTIRFFWVPETYGSVAYLSNHNEASTTLVAGINLDMVGQDQELCRSTLNLDRTPDSLPSYLNDLVYSFIEESVEAFDDQTVFGSASTFRYATNAFSGGSDHAEFTESTTHVPCVMLLQWPDLFYHTSLDTIDKVSEESLKRVAWIAATSILTLANADIKTAFRLVNQTVTQATARISEIGRRSSEELFGKIQDSKLEDKSDQLGEELVKTANDHRRRIQHLIWREPEAINSVERLAKSDELQSYIVHCCKDIADAGEKEIYRIERTLDFIAKTLDLALPTIEETEAEREAKKLVPTKLFKGTLNADLVKKTLVEKEYEWYQRISEKDKAFGKKMSEILNFMDGERDVYTIAKAVSAEYGQTNMEHVLKYLRNLEKANLVSFKPRLDL